MSPEITIKQLGAEITGIQRILIKMQSDIRDLGDSVEEIRDKYDPSAVQKVIDIVNGTGGSSGLQKSVDRLITLIDGDATRDVEGVRHRIECLETEIDELKRQRDMVKWAIVGMSIAGVGNTGALITLLVKVLGGG